MTVASEDVESCLIRVRAQVMTRDDSTGGWVPMDGGGLSHVSVCKQETSVGKEPKNEYLILGHKLSDQSVILSCVIKKDFEYNKVMPTFHHWKSGNKKFGLTFQTAADARAFDRGIKIAVEELIDGFAAQYKLFQKLNNVEDVGDDDDVFMTLNLPVEREESRSSSDSSTGKTPPPPPTPIVLEQDVGGGVNYTFKHLPGVQEYSRPINDETKVTISTALSTDNDQTLKKKSPLAPPSLPSKIPGGRRKERCQFCHEAFYRDNNPRGSCEYAPDCVKNAINTITCISCAQCMLYHCMNDPEGDFERQPCFCSTADDQWTRRWIGLALLSLIVPCLCCYPPLRACHMGCITCGICGGRHAPISQ